MRPETMGNGLGSRQAAAGFGLEVGAMAATLLVQLGYAAYTGRHVAAAHFGAYATALTLLQISASLTTGLTQLVLKRPEWTRDGLGSVLLVAVGTGGASCLLLELLAPLCDLVWSAPHLVGFVRVLSLQTLIAPVASVCMAVLRTQARFSLAVALEFTGQLTGFTAGAAFLCAGLNPLGIATVSVASVVVPAVVGVLHLRPRAGLRGFRLGDQMRELGPCLRHAAMHSAMYGLPTWVAAATLGPTTTGYYSRALYFASMVPTILTQAVIRVTTPTLAIRFAAGGSAFGEGLSAVLSAASAVTACSLGVTAALGPTALCLLLGPGWERAGALVPWFLAGLGLLLLCTLGHQADETRRDSKGVWANQRIIAAVIGGGSLLAVLAPSPHALITTTAAATLIGHTAQLWRWQRTGVLAARPILLAYGSHTLLALVVCGTTLLGASLTGSPALQVAGGLAAALLALGCALAARRHIPALRLAAAHGLLPVARRRSGPNAAR
ncbi:oligosaccharide flippase family protein [Streptomyces sp. NPDC051917]|uniref:lipopolysaccharide biosynthesis protein n=1 Tax=Streptomyces sp. NPDC051917 TaxID=3154754 RepID=UPI00344C4A43